VPSPLGSGVPGTSASAAAGVLALGPSSFAGGGVAGAGTSVAGAGAAELGATWSGLGFRRGDRWRRNLSRRLSCAQREGGDGEPAEQRAGDKRTIDHVHQAVRRERHQWVPPHTMCPFLPPKSVRAEVTPQ